VARPGVAADVEESDPFVYKSLVWLQEHRIGAHIRVTEENKAEFATRMIQNLLHDRFVDQITAFCQ
jgi:hypothetical protein